MKIDLKKILIVVCIASLLMVLGYSIKWWSKPTSDFMAYYSYSRLLLEGKQLQKFYDYDEFNQYISSLGFPKMKVKPHNLPSNAFGMLPFAWLSPGNAKIAWTIFSLILYFFTVKILLSLNGLTFKESLGIGLASDWEGVLLPTQQPTTGTEIS